MDGILVLDKPGGMTSRDAVNRVQRWFPRKTRIGHTGTLDPLATGVLVICIGASTRLADYVQAMPKTYLSRFRLGATSTTDDADGEVTLRPDAVPPPRDQIDSALASFIGTIEQVPPAYSALKLAGERAHDLARKGEPVELKPRPVRIDAIRIHRYEWPFVDVEIDCGKGTYIRSIARDLGKSLGCGGMVETLRRTRIGPFRAEDAVTLETDPERAPERMRPVAEAVSYLPAVTLDESAIKGFLNGGTVPVAPSAGAAPAGEVAVYGPANRFLGVGVMAGAARLKPKCVIASQGTS